MPSSNALGEDRFQRGAGVVARRRQLHQHVPGMPARQRIADVDAVTHAEIDGDVGQQLETGEGAGGLVLRDRQQLQRVGGRSEADIGGFHRARLRKQLQRRRGDDAERAFGADEQVAQVVAGVVLLQLRQPVAECGRRPAPLRARAPARAPRHRPAPRCRRHWSRDCRRWCSFPRRRATAETAGRLRRRAAARSAAPRRPRRSWCWRRRRCRGSCPSAASRPPPRHDAGSGRRPARYCRPAAPARSGARWRACRSRRLPPSSPAAAPAASGRETGRVPR